MTTEYAFFEAVDGISEDLDDVIAKVSAMVDAYNNRGKSFADFLVWVTFRSDDLHAAMQQVVDGVNEVILAIQELASPGNPIRMLAIAGTWDTVVSKLTGQIAFLDNSQFDATSDWTGIAGHRYAGLPGQQAAAIGGIAGHLASLSALMSGHATSLIDTWVDLASQFGHLVLTLIDDAAAFITADPLEWLDIVPKIVAVVTDILRFVIDVATTLAKYATSIVNEITTLHRETADQTGSMAGHWPTTTFA